MMGCKNEIVKKNVIIGSVVTIILLVLVTLVFIFVIHQDSGDDNDNPPENPSITDPDEIPLPFTRSLIVKINNSSLWARDIDGDGSMFVIKNWTTPFDSFDFYHKKNIYLGSIEDGQAITSYTKTFSQLNQPGIWHATKISVDNVHDKVYALDELAAKINVFDVWSGYYNIISIDLNQPKDIAIDPVERLLFILQLTSILKTSLDGSSPKVIIEKTGISAFQIDIDQKRIYLATSQEIQSVDYAGQNVTTIEKISNPIISLAVSNNSLFWLNPSSDYENPKLWFCKVTNGFCQDTSHSVFDDNAVEIKAYNFSKLQVSNPCKNMNNCRHMCVNSNDKPRCICTIGWQLKNDLQSCEKIDDFLLYAQGDFIKGRILDHSKDTFTTALLPFRLNVTLWEKNKMLKFDFDAKRHELIFSDDNSVSKINLKPGSQQIFMGGDSKERRVNPAIDWIARNFYFVKTMYGDFYEIDVQSIEPYDSSTVSRVLFRIFEQNIPTSIVVHPNRGILFVTLVNGFRRDQVEIVKSNLDGTHRETVGKNLSISDIDNSLAMDYEDDRLFWLDVTKTKVYSADFEGLNLSYIDVSIIENPTMLNIYGHHIYISNFTSVWRLNKKTGRDIRKILPTFGYESQRIRGAKVFSAKYQVTNDDHPCAGNNGGCERYCFSRPKTNAKSLGMKNQLERVCGCNSNEKLDSDGRNCLSYS